MSGAYTHIAVANKARQLSDNADLRPETQLALGRYLRYVELGAVSPDYPYLCLKPKQAKWADEMHYTSTAAFIRTAVQEVGQLSGLRRQKLMAWLFGFASHIATDMTIHPVVELKVGPYSNNKTGHRICEMNQDAYLFPKVMNLGETAYSEHMKTGIGACCDRADPDKLDPDVAGLWTVVLHQTHPNLATRHPADPDAWHEGFTSILSAMATASRLIPFARHVVRDAGLMYPLEKDVDPQYVRNLQTPLGQQDFDAIFERACRSVVQMWEGLDKELAQPDASAFDQLEDWNLDTGRSLKSNQLVFWGA
ncbi:zinc dependent phospholipase C family protein [uncultured Hydrogenophaga sp.]|uniref:zinc dependent phospholipase C family protein n=1 Tax=uncultured Hydrogenophaga sp. TaxID=199683 RepID=UPI00265D881E|nr:zinc dependent phospholipase C family protein [uncultured Hydrogenophaga sp.]